MTFPQALRSPAAHFAIAAVVSASGYAASSIIQKTWASPLLIAFVLAAAIAVFCQWNGLTLTTSAIGSIALRVGVALLGARVTMTELETLGAGVLAAGALVAVGGSVAVYLSSKLALRNAEAAVVGAGCSVCGASACLAASESLRARSDDTALTILFLTFLGLASIPIFDGIAQATGMSSRQHAVWLGLALPEVAHVAMATLGGDDALAPAAMIAKMARILCLAPALVALAALQRSGPEGRPALAPPAYIWLFAIVAIASAFGYLPPPAGIWLQRISSMLLVFAMAAVGLSFRISSITATAGPLLVTTTIGVIVVALLSWRIAILF